MMSRIAAAFLWFVFSFIPVIATSQDCLEPVGQWPYGWSNDVAADGDLAVIANGRAVQIVDLSLPANAAVVGEVFVPTDVIQAVAISGDRTYAAIRERLFVIDLVDPSAPVVVGSLTGFAAIHEITVAGDSVYLLDARKLVVVDVTAPTLPVVVGEIEWPAYSLLDVAVTSTHAYVTTDDDGLRVVDIVDPTLPVEVAELDFGVDRNAPRLDLEGGNAFVSGYDFGLSQPMLFVVDISDPTQPSLDLEMVVSESGGDIAVSGGLAHLANQVYGLQLYDVSTPLSPSWQGSAPTTCTYGQSVSAVAGVGLVTCENEGLSVVDTGTPATPVVVAEIWVPGHAWNGDYSDGLLAIAGVDQGLRLVDVSDPTAPVEHGSTFFFQQTRDVALDGDLAVAVGWSNQKGLTTLDVSDPDTPVILGSAPPWGGGEAVELVGGLAYVAIYGGGLRLVDVSVPTGPVEIGRLELSGVQWNEIAVSGDLIALRGGGSNPMVALIDVSDPTAPVLLWDDLTSSAAGGVAIYRSVLYLGDGLLRLFDIRDPAAPVELAPYGPVSGGVGDVAVSGSVVYLQTWGTVDEGVEAIDIGHPRNPVFVGLSHPIPWLRGLALSDDEVFAITWFTGFDTLALCQGPVFADGFETGDTSAWSSAVP